MDGSCDPGRESLKITLEAHSRRETNLRTCVDVRLRFKIPQYVKSGVIIN